MMSSGTVKKARAKAGSAMRPAMSGLGREAVESLRSRFGSGGSVHGAIIARQHHAVDPRGRFGTDNAIEHVLEHGPGIALPRVAPATTGPRLDLYLHRTPEMPYRGLPGR